MATPTLTPGFTVLSTADANTGWSAGTVDSEVVKQGSASLSGILRTTGLNTRTYTSTTFDSTGQHLRMWLNYASIGFLQTKANGGIRLFAQDTGGAIGYWYLGGIDTYDGGWVLLQVDMDAAFDSGSANRTIINRTGFTLNLTGAPRNATNCWYDYLVRGNGLTVTGGTSGDAVLLDGISSVDASNGYGAVRKVNGVYFVNTNLILGTASNIFFEDSNQIIVFEDQPVDSDLYKILATGTGTTSFKLTSSVIKSASTLTRFDLLLGDANLNTLEFAGNSVVNADQVRFKSGQTIDTVVFQNCTDIAPTGATVTGSTFSQCGTVTLGASTLTGCSFLGSTGTSALLAGSSVAGVTNTEFVRGATGHAIEITATGTYTFTGLSFSGYAASNGSTGNETVFVNVGSGSVTINTDSAISVRTAGATVTVVAGQRTLTVTGVVPGSDVVIYDSAAPVTGDGTNVLQTSDAIAGTSATYSYTYSAGEFVDVGVFRSGYVPLVLKNIPLANSDQALPVAQRVDINYVA
jgi:hypothetical protein